MPPFGVVGLVVCGLVANISWFLMLEKVKEREPAVSWWERSILKIHRLYRLHYPDGKLVWIHYSAILGALSILLAFLSVFGGKS